MKIAHLKLEELEEGQIGYSIDQQGNCLVSNEEGAWKAEWVVIGNEVLCGDPIIIDTREEGVPVFTLMHGMGNWNGGGYLSKSIDKFANEIKKVNDFIYESTMKNINPKITCENLDNLVSEIIQDDEYGDFDNWKSMLEPIYKSTEKYEDNLTAKIKAMTENGMKIKEISVILNMSIRDTYRYLKRNVVDRGV